MNYSTQTIVDFSYYISMVRDLGCYILYEPEQLLNLFEDQKHSLKIEMQVQSPINKVMLNNGEAGQKFRDGALAFYEFLFEKEKYLDVVNGKVVVKHEYDVRVTKEVINELIVLLPMVDQHIEAYQKANILEKEAKELAYTLKQYTLSCINLVIYVLVEKSFYKYNELKHSAQLNAKEEADACLQNTKDLLDLYVYVGKALHSDDQRIVSEIHNMNDVFMTFSGGKPFPQNETLAEYTLRIRRQLIDTTKELSIEYMNNFAPLMKELYTLQEEMLKKSKN